MAAGVAGGLGEYFGLDPVLFRVLFAVTSFFGGAGILAYLIGWAVIPERGTARAPLDRLAGWFRRHNIPLWLAATIVVIIAWAGLFSWWAPGPATPVLIAVVILVVVFARRSKAGPATAPTGDYLSAPPVANPAEVPVAPAGSEAWLPETRSWIAEARAAGQARRHRRRPVFWSSLGVLTTTIAALAIADAAGGIVLPVYFWVAGAIVLAALAVGLVIRRPVWSLSPLLVPAALGLIAFGGSGASLHDGAGRTNWAPSASASLPGDYRLAFGQAVLDLRDLAPLESSRTVDITMGAGQVRILVPAGLNVTIDAHVHIGTVQVDGRNAARRGSGDDVAGVNVHHVIDPPTGAAGAQLRINVHLADGDVSLEHS